MVTGGGVQVYHTHSLLEAMGCLRDKGQGQHQGQSLPHHQDKGQSQIQVQSQSQSLTHHQDKGQGQGQIQGQSQSQSQGLGLSALLPLLVTDHYRQMAALRMLSSLLQLSAPALVAFTSPGPGLSPSAGSGAILNTRPGIGASPSPCPSCAVLYCLVATSRDARASRKGGITTVETLKVSSTPPPPPPPPLPPPPPALILYLLPPVLSIPPLLSRRFLLFFSSLFSFS